ncbi:ABC transporter substrate-binding protein [Pigmentiphaga daeguensis]|uniref:ABC transporter substrate-binding protein n=1 Tax=Pigmentiphaga daeguensis TaxID=414049 RepID=A0ABN1CM09_9BURK
MRKSPLALSIAALAFGFAGMAHAADPIKVGLALDLSGPFATAGAEARDGFDLAIEKLGSKLGGQPAQFLKNDFAGSPDQVIQLVKRYVDRDKIDFFTGPIASNSALAAGPALFAAKVPFLSSNPGPSQYAGKQCNPYFFGLYQNDTYDETAGILANTKGYKKVVIIAPNYPAGKDHLGGFKRFYKGEIQNEVYTKVGQIDYAAEIAQIRSSKPDAVYVFLPGGMGINFIKQYVAGGLKDTPLLISGSGADEDVIRAVGESMLGTTNTAHWAHDLKVPANVEFVAAYKKKYGHFPSVYAAQAYDTIMAMDAAVRDVGGNLKDKAALLKALKAANFETLRGRVNYGPNNFPVQAFYQRTIVKLPDGTITNKLDGIVVEKHQDAHVQDCKMAS